MKPFLPWPGSKEKCSRAIISAFPGVFRNYYEPFLGSGSVFFAMNYIDGYRDYKQAFLSDINPKLINCWKAVMERPEHVKKLLANLLEKNTEAFYKASRSNMESPSVFLYVMRAAFSSMYRENRFGQFNVPWRKQDFEVNRKPISFDMERLSACSEHMLQKNAQLSVAPWMSAVQDAGPGDVVYLDPPYLPFADNGFVSYVAGGFSEGEYVFMNTEAKKMAERGVFVAMSNSDTPATRRLFGEPHKKITVTNSVKANATDKGTRVEGLWIWKK